MRRNGGSRRREYMTALRREAAKHGHEHDPDLAAFDCMLLCMSCGHLSEPSAGDPMRREAEPERRSCSMCGAPGLTDLRQTGMVESLSQLESNEAQPSRWARAGKLLGVMGIASLFAGAMALFAPAFSGGLADHISSGYLMVPIGLVGTAVVGRSFAEMWHSTKRRVLPRRWRMPRTAKRNAARARSRGSVEAQGELLRAPLSGRPCVAWEVAVRDDADPSSSFGSWRLIEQDNVGFRVGEVDVAAGEALLQVERELVSEGVIGSADPVKARYMRIRGVLESEDVYVYESIVEPGATCTVSRRAANEPVRVRG